MLKPEENQTLLLTGGETNGSMEPNSSEVYSHIYGQLIFFFFAKAPSQFRGRQGFFFLTNSVRITEYYLWKKLKRGDFPGGPVVKLPHFRCRDVGLIPVQGTMIMCVIQPKKKRKKKKKFILKIKEYKEVLEINNAKANIPPNGQRLKDT